MNVTFMIRLFIGGIKLVLLWDTWVDNTNVGGQENLTNANEDEIQRDTAIQSASSSASKKNKFQNQALHYYFWITLNII